MSRILLKNGYVVTVDNNRAVHPDGFIVVDGQKISAVGPAAAVPLDDGFDKVIDARGCIVLPGLINCHQHHWYTLFKGLADGIGVEDWVSNFLLPLGRNLPEEGMRISSYVAAMEMLATGTTCSLNHSTTTTTPSMVKAAIEPQAELGIRQIYAKELRCKTSSNPNHLHLLTDPFQKPRGSVRRVDGSETLQSPAPGFGEKYWSLSGFPSHSFQSGGGVFLTVIFGQIFAYSAFSDSHLSSPSSVSALMASTGHSGSQTPQSMHSSGWITSMFSPS
jgi:cytosine/adenosine deaminase-related metal-dependent hydrolase